MDAEQEIHLRDYLRVVKNRRWTVVAFFLIVVTVVAVVTWTARPVYQSTVQLLIDRDNPNVVSIQEVLAVDATATDYYQTQYEILKTEMLARRVIALLDLTNAAEFAAAPPNPVLEWIRGWFPAGTETSSNPSPDSAAAARERQVVRAFLERVEVKPIRNSRLVKVSVNGYDPALAARMANALADEYISYNLEAKLGAAQRATNWLTGQVDEMQAKVRASEDALEAYKVAVPAQVMAEVETPNGLRQLESRPEVVNNAFIQGLKGEEIKLAAKEAELSKKFGPKHPQMIQVRTELAALRGNLDKEVRRLLGAVKVEDAPQFQLLKREAETNRQIYEVLLKRHKETTLTESIPRNNIQVVDPAVLPDGPTKPRKRMNMVLAVVIGLVGGMGLAFFVEYLDNSIKSSEDVERILGFPLLGLVPERRKGKDVLPIETVVTQDPRSVHAEAYRTIRTGVMLSVADRPPKTILVTSPGPEEGKSVTAANLATAMAQAGNSVVIVDADLRKPRIFEIFGMDNARGLGPALVGEIMLDFAVRPTASPLLSVITSGPVPPNPAELLGGKRMQEVLEELGRRFDRIVIDSPPLVPVTDATVLAAFCDGVVLVVKEGVTTRELATEARRRLLDAKARVLGVVLNGVGSRQAGYPYYYAYYGKERSASAAVSEGRQKDEGISMIAAAVSVANRRTDIPRRELRPKPDEKDHKRNA